MITTNNEAWGFYGTAIANSNGRVSAKRAAVLFDKVAGMLVARFGVTNDQARDFLDSRDGRHLADEMVSPCGKLDELPRWVRLSLKRFGCVVR